MNIVGERITDKIWQELKVERLVIVKFEMKGRRVRGDKL